MLNILSIFIGLFAALLVIPGMIPFFGWVNWIMLPFGGAALLLGLLSSRNEGRNLAIVVLAIGIIRLWIGGGFF